MSCLGFLGGGSWLHRIDPRCRLVAAAVLTGVVSLSPRFTVPAWALVLSAALSAAARLPVRPLGRRLAHINLFLLFLWLVLPWSTPGAPLGTVAGLTATREGLVLAAAISLKANAIVLLFTVLVATIPPHDLAFAVTRLGAPAKLAHIFLFTVRYTDLIHEEVQRLRTAMKCRGFQPRFSCHTLRSVGYLVGMLLVRTIERSERVLAAMKCRGFEGRFHTLTELAIRPVDIAFTAAALLQAGTWVWLEVAV